MTLKTKPILLTGASGNLGQAVVPLLLEDGWSLRLTDINPYPKALPANAEFVQADLEDEAEIVKAAYGTGGIVHLGALVAYGTLQTVLGPNMVGMHSVFEAARLEGIRVVNASSNHVIGFHPRTERLDEDAPARPDSYYGLSKAYGELVARYYYDRYGVESVSLRIGSCFEEPKNERMLATWLSRSDLARLIGASLTASETGCAMVWGNSANSQSWWGTDDRARLGWEPRDSADSWIGKFPDPTTSIEDRYQGGKFCTMP